MYLDRYYAKKNINTLNYVLLIIFSEFVILFPHDLTLSHKLVARITLVTTLSSRSIICTLCYGQLADTHKV